MSRARSRITVTMAWFAGRAARLVRRAWRRAVWAAGGWGCRLGLHAMSRQDSRLFIMNLYAMCACARQRLPMEAVTARHQWPPYGRWRRP